MSDQLAKGLGLDPTSPAMIAELEAFEQPFIGQEPVDVPTTHVIHAGMYARTIAIPADMVLTGVVIKRATLVIVAGKAKVLVGENNVLELDGYNILPAFPGRKQVFRTFSTVLITMVFPTTARTVEDAEREFTDEFDRLLSRRQNANTVCITEE